MLEIKIAACRGFNETDFRKLLPSRRETYIDVLLPKKGNKDNPERIGYEYMKAAYVGQMLYDIATDFMFSLPEPYRKGNFSYIVATTQWKKMAALLTRVLRSYTRKQGAFDFDDDMSVFYQNLPPAKELACEPFLYYIDIYDYPPKRSRPATKNRVAKSKS